MKNISWDYNPFIDKSLLPKGFEYPSELKHLVKLGLVNFERYYFFDSDLVTARYESLRKRYKNRILIPFARRNDCDDIACIDVNMPGIQRIHDFASPGWEQKESFNTFWNWFKYAIDEMIESNIIEEESEYRAGNIIIESKQSFNQQILNNSLVDPYFIRCLNEIGMVNFDIWCILNISNAVNIYNSLNKIYPENNCIPFAQRRDNNNIACFINNKSNIIILEDAQKPFENIFEYASAWDWLKEAIKIMIINYEQVGR